MRVLQVVPHHPAVMVGGAVIFAHSLSKLLTNRGVDVKFLTTYPCDISKPEVQESFPIFWKRSFITIQNTNPVALIMPKVVELSKESDIIHAHSYVFMTTLEATIAKRVSRRPMVLHLHGGLDTRTNSHGLYAKFKDDFYDPIIGRFIARSADMVISVSKHDVALARKMFKVEKEKIVWIPNAVNTEVFAPKTNAKRDSILFVGRFDYWKGFDIFANICKKICKKFPKISVIVICSGNKLILRELEKICNIEYYEKVPHKRMPEFYNRAKFLLVTSRVEGLPTGILESLACGTPVVSSSVGGIPEVVIDGQTGYKFSVGDTDRAVEICEQLIKNEEKLEEMKKTGVDFVRKNHAWDNVVKKIMEVYKLLV